MKWANDATEPETSQRTTSSGLCGLCGRWWVTIGTPPVASDARTVRRKSSRPARPRRRRAVEPGREPPGQRVAPCARSSTMSSRVARRKSTCSASGLHRGPGDLLDALAPRPAAGGPRCSTSSSNRFIRSVMVCRATFSASPPRSSPLQQTRRAARPSASPATAPAAPGRRTRTAGRLGVGPAERLTASRAKRRSASSSPSSSSVAQRRRAGVPVRRLAVEPSRASPSRSAPARPARPSPVGRREPQVEERVEGGTVRRTLHHRRGEGGPQVLAAEQVDLPIAPDGVDRLGQRRRAGRPSAARRRSRRCGRPGPSLAGRRRAVGSRSCCRRLVERQLGWRRGSGRWRA